MTSGLGPYPAYKDSGVPWLGQVPDHWDVARLRHAVDMRVSNVDKHANEEELPVRLCNYVDVYKNDWITSKLPFMRATAQPAEVERFRLQLDDVLITKDSETWTDIGVPALVKYAADDLVCGYHLALLRPRQGRVQGPYLFRALQSRVLAYQFHVQANGVTRYGLSHGAIRSVLLPLPPAHEQVAVAKFLDRVDRRVSRYIRAKQKLVALLNEQKQAIIHRAVTRGLDPNVRLKPSGVGWLGDVPERWEVQRLKTLLMRATSGSRGWSNFAANDGPLFLRVGNLTRTSIDLNLSDTVRLNLPRAAVAEGERTQVCAGDLLLSITAYIGSVAVVPPGLGEAYVSQHVACCRLVQGVANVRWLAYVLLSPVGQTHGRLCMYGGTKQGLSLDDVKNYVVLLPPKADQDALVSAIERDSRSLDGAFSQAQEQISLLREYRTRLIADVVTGKLDVRELATRLPESDAPESIDTDDGSAEPVGEASGAAEGCAEIDEDEA